MWVRALLQLGSAWMLPHTGSYVSNALAHEGEGALDQTG